MLKASAYYVLTRFDLARTIFGRGRYWTTAYLFDGVLIDSVCAYSARELAKALKDMPSESQQANIYPVYYYKITFSGETITDVRVQYAYGIPAQRTLRGFKFPVVHQDRLWLCCGTNKDKHYVICSAYQSPTVLGYGSDNAEFWLGDDTE